MQVTLFAYSDLLLFTKEDEPGRCNVLRNPLYLQSVKLQEGRCGPEMPQTPSHLPRAPLLWVAWMPSSDQCLRQWGCQPAMGHLSMCSQVRPCPRAARLSDTCLPF